MKSVVGNNFNEEPQFESNFPAPIANNNETIVNVIASSLSNRARSGALGNHYSSTGKLPMIPGVDGIGTLPNGKKVYFVGNGSFAEQAAVLNHHWVKVPDGLNDIKLAGLMNPAMSSWMALKYRAHFKKGQKVMILGATGNAGSLAIQIAKRLGASKIVAVARNSEKLNQAVLLGATHTVCLTDDNETVTKNLANVGKDIDVVLDYLWGDVSATAMTAIIPNRDNDRQLLKWVEIGSSAGATSPIPGAAFRAVTLELIGSGQGSVSPLNIIKTLKEILKSEKAKPFEFSYQELPLSSFTKGWNDTSSNRVVFNINK